MRLFDLCEGDRLLDKVAGPRIKGGLAKMASEANIHNAEVINKLAVSIMRGIRRNKKGFSTQIDLSKLDDWRQGGAAIIRVSMPSDGLIRPLTITVMGDNNIVIKLPAEVMPQYPNRSLKFSSPQQCIDVTIQTLEAIHDNYKE